jgi:hypothetical protein
LVAAHPSQLDGRDAMGAFAEQIVLRARRELAFFEVVDRLTIRSSFVFGGGR